MSLIKRLEKEAGKSRPGLACRVGSILLSSDMTDEDREYLKKVLETSSDDPARIPTTAVTQALRLEGFDVGTAQINRHRRHECRCYGSSPKFNLREEEEEA